MVMADNEDSITPIIPIEKSTFLSRQPTVTTKLLPHRSTPSPKLTKGGDPPTCIVTPDKIDCKI